MRPDRLAEALKPVDLLTSPPCGAKTPTGPCQQERVDGRQRCRLHGGGVGSGASSGARNGRFVNGGYTKEAKAERKWLRGVLAGSAAEGEMLDQLGEVTIAPAVPVPPNTMPKSYVAAQVYQAEGTVDYRA